MWIKRSEYITLLTNANEAKVRVEMLQFALDGQKEVSRNALTKYSQALKAEREKNALLAARVSELEKKLLEFNDTINQLKKVAPTPLDLNAMFDEEDQEEVAKMRQRIQAEGADIVLAEMMEK